MDQEGLISIVNEGKIKPQDTVDNQGTVFVTVLPAEMMRFGKFLMETPELHFNLLEYAYGTDWLEKGQIEVGYLLTSVQHQHDIVFRCYVPRDEPQLASLTKLWLAADWHEREIYDLLGVTFEGHPNMTRILTPPQMEGHPLRKDYSHPDFEPLPQ